MKQSELGIGMATVAYRCPSLLQMAFSFNSLPEQRSSTTPQFSDKSSPYADKMNFNKKVKGNTSKLSVNKEQEEGILRPNFENQNKEQCINGSCEKKEKANASTEVKENTTIPAMVLSERELLSVNKKQEEEILRLNLMIKYQNKKVKKLMDLCMVQREEIKSLKMSILFPDVTNYQLQKLVEKQGSELKEAKQSLQQQVSSLTGQLQSLAEDLAEVKADKDSAKTGFQGYEKSPRTPPPPPGREDA